MMIEVGANHVLLMLYLIRQVQMVTSLSMQKQMDALQEMLEKATKDIATLAAQSGATDIKVKVLETPTRRNLRHLRKVSGPGSMSTSVTNSTESNKNC